VELFKTEDIRIGADALTAECDFTFDNIQHTFLIHRPRAASAPRLKNTGMPREQVHSTPERVEYIGNRPASATGKESNGRPFALLFSTLRAVPSERSPSTAAAAGGIPAAYADAFSNRELRLGEFAAWMRVRQTLSREKPANRQILLAFEESVRRFLPAYSNLRASNEKKPRLLIDHGSTTLEVRQLSDGERGTLAMVLDLTRRLAQANPNMTDPAAQAEAVVLIDEIDLHLHPGWQRKIVQNLSAAFPKCQFIATTHSPQVIGEVEHERIQIISHKLVYAPTHSFGVDSSRVLEEVMESAPRTAGVQKLLSSISKTIADREYAAANKLLTKLVEQIGEDDPEVTRARTLIEFMGDNK
jgi:hypothetical protein